MEIPIDPPSAPRPGSGAVRGKYPGDQGSNSPAEAGSPKPPRSDWASLRRIGLLGGSFDPVHAGHLHVASSAQRARGLERVVFLPAARPPHKPDQILASGEDRVAMLELALRGHPDWIVDGLELGRSGPSYTIDTVRALRERWSLHSDARLYLVLGSDNLRGFAHWKDAASLLQLTEPVVVPRESDMAATIERLRAELAPELAAKLERSIVAVEAVIVASSEIRHALRAGILRRGELPEGVQEYIESRGIYGARGRGAPRT